MSPLLFWNLKEMRSL